MDRILEINFNNIFDDYINNTDNYNIQKVKNNIKEVKNKIININPNLDNTHFKKEYKKIINEEIKQKIIEIELSIL